MILNLRSGRGGKGNSLDSKDDGDDLEQPAFLLKRKSPQKDSTARRKTITLVGESLWDMGDPAIGAFLTTLKGNKINTAPYVPSYRFHDKDFEEYWKIRFLDFEVLKKRGCFPRFVAEGKRHPGEFAERFLTVGAREIDYEKSLMVFVSHQWLRSTAPEPSPDTENNDQYKLCVQAVQYILDHWTCDIAKCYLWIDFSCHTLYHDGSQSPSAVFNMKVPMDKIMSLCDCMVTPLYEGLIQQGGEVAIPTSTSSFQFLVDNTNNLSTTTMTKTSRSNSSVNPQPLSPSKPEMEVSTGVSPDYYYRYTATSLFGPSGGYMSRAWCRLEMLYCGVVPILKDISPENSRRNRLSGPLKSCALRDQRPHFIFGTAQESNKEPPLVLSPLYKELTETFNPCAGKLTMRSDRGVISHMYSKLKGTYYDTEQTGVGYTGGLNEKGEMHGGGVYRHQDGTVERGAWVNGLKQGFFHIEYPDGRKLAADFFADREAGLCTFENTNGDIYYGSMLDGKKIGQGIIEYKNGENFEGFFVNDMKEGKGVMHYTNGEIYSGEFKHDQRHGLGEIRTSDYKLIAKGRWRNDMKLTRRGTM